MILIIGGAAQGKKGYATTYFPERPMIEDVHLLIEACLKNGGHSLEYTKEIINDNKEAVFIMNEIGLGIVPIDPFARKWREEVGRAGCLLAEEATEVYRVIAGIGTRIK